MAERAGGAGRPARRRPRAAGDVGGSVSATVDADRDERTGWVLDARARRALLLELRVGARAAQRRSSP